MPYLQNIRPLYKAFLIACSLITYTSGYSISLQEAFEGAFSHDLSYQVSKFTWLRDQRDKKIALSPLLPQAQVQATSSTQKTQFPDIENKPTLDSSSENINLSVSQTLLDLENYALYQAASTQSQNTSLAFHQKTQLLITQTAQYYTSLLMAIDNLDFTQAEKAETELRFQDVSQKVRAGVMTQTDLSETQAQLERIQAHTLAAQQSVIEAEETLKDSTGITTKKIKGLHTKKHLADAPIAPLDTWLNLAKKHNLDIQMAKKNLGIAQSQEKAQQASYTPTLKARGGLNYHRNYSDDQSAVNALANNLYNEDSQFASIQLQLPLLTGGYRYQRNHQAKDNTQVFERLLAKTQQDIFRAIRTVYHKLESGKKIIQANAQAVYYASELVKMNKLKLQAGATTMLEVLDNISKLRADQQALAESRYHYILNYLEIKRLAGQLKPSDLQEISRYFTEQKSIPSNI